MEQKLARNSEAYTKCNDVFMSYLDKGYIDKVSKDNVPSYFIPYFPLFKETRTTTKCRIVFDCAAKFHGVSLNDKILTGPKLQNDIIDVLTQFRMFSYAIMGDISEMYLQIKLDPDDRKYCRFVWNSEIYEWNRTMFGRKDAPFIALKVINLHAEKYRNKYGDSVNVIQDSIYIDDLAHSRDTEENIQTLVKEVSEIMSEAGMVIGKLMTNSKKILDDIPPELRAKEVDNLFDDLPMTKLLGLSWNVQNDELFFNLHLKEAEVDDICTKRSILKTMARLYDPLGMLTPFTILAKILFQQVWVTGANWDDDLRENIKQQWTSWKRQLKDLGELRIPRYLGLREDQTFSIHLFSDASIEAFSAAAFTRTKYGQSETTRLVLSKAKVTPLKSRSIPQLELLAATLAVRIAYKICRIMKYDVKQVTFWEDSQNVLFWIRKTPKMFKTFVSNRVSEIQQVTSPSQWRYCPTNFNVADIPTRGRTVRELISTQTWWEGPQFLKEEECKWPARMQVDQVQEVDLRPMPITCLTNIMNDDFPLNPIKWSDKRQLIKRTAFVNRFITNCRENKDRRNFSKFLNSDEWIKAEQLLIKVCQKESFSDEIKDLKTGSSVKRSSKILQMNPFLDSNGLMRSNSRLSKVAWLEDEVKYPVILPKHHAMTWLIVKQVHEKIGHPLSINAALNEIQRRFWIIRARSLLKLIQAKCMVCKLAKEKCLQPKMAPIPRYRFDPPLQAFSKTGLDFAGSFLTKRSARGLSKNKRYMALFTCLQTRAVHIEMVYSLETGSFMNALARMIARRGCPREIVSDNGRTFVRANRELKKLVENDRQKIQNEGRLPISWYFNPPFGSSFGGIFEIMIKSAKRALSCVMQKADLNDEELVTAFCEGEALLNSRPLTKPSDDIHDVTSLTPNHFLIGRLDPGNLGSSTQSETDGLHPKRRWIYVQMLINHYWNRWQK